MSPTTMSQPTGGVSDGVVGMLNVFIDPATTARKVPSKLSWLPPVIVLIIGFGIVGYLMLPYTLQLGEAALRQRNMPPEQMETAMNMTRMISRITAPMMPLFAIAGVALSALLIKVVFIMMDVRPKFRDLFSLLAACSLIPLLQAFAAVFVLRAKGEPVTSPEQLQPPFGLDIFAQGLHGPLYALLGFFSLFEIWYLVVLCIGLAVLTHTTKTKSLIAMTPAWLVPLAFKMVGALLQPPPAQ